MPPSIPALAANPSTIDPNDAIRADLRAVLELFTSELREVTFPGVDASVLRQHADEVRASAREVERARAALDAALNAFDERSQALAALASRGLAYARIYAAEQPALAARLAELDGGATSPTTAAAPGAPAKRPRGRPRKHPRPQLPLDADAAANDDAGDEPADDAAVADERAVAGHA